MEARHHRFHPEYVDHVERDQARRETDNLALQTAIPLRANDNQRTERSEVYHQREKNHELVERVPGRGNHHGRNPFALLQDIGDLRDRGGHNRKRAQECVSAQLTRALLGR